MFMSNGADDQAQSQPDSRRDLKTIGWLLFWFAIALVIRFTHLASKPAWMDEVSTVLFSLGNSSRLILTGEVISLDQILRALHVTPGATAKDVVVNLLSENNHPPAYFVLAHWWMKLFPQADGYASLWAARALPAIFGALAVPLAYVLAKLSFRNASFNRARSIGLICAALMAVSPFSVFLSQEARHYTLAILMIMGSLCCFVMAVQAVNPDASDRHRPLGWPTVLAWVVINTLSISVHYFCGIGICAEGLVLLVMLVRQLIKRGDSWRRSPWPKIYVTAAGSLAGALIWLPILLNFYGSPQTTYITSAQGSWKFWINPIAQSVVGWLYAIMSPITSIYGGWLGTAVVIISCVLLLLLYVPWVAVYLGRSLQFQWAQPSLKTGLWAIGGFFIMGNLLFFVISYGLGFDITRGHRYSFVYFPSTLVLAGAALASYWPAFWQMSSEPKYLEQSSNFSFSAEAQKFQRVKLLFLKRFISDRAFVATVIIVGFLGAQVIVNDLSHLKFYKADRFVNLVRETSTLPVVIGIDATVSDQPSVIGNEIVSVAWEIKQQLDTGVSIEKWVQEPKFVIAERNTVTNSDPVIQLVNSLKAMPRPFD
ncbi:MAG: glycosyltransferase family 39 protein, partial [Phormidesmis sp.]